MAFQLGDSQEQTLNEINLIPLIDIMLVLMIIFLVTATVINPSVPLNLPKTSAQAHEPAPEMLQISIDKHAGIFWENEPINLDELNRRFAEQHTAGKNPSIQLRADKAGKYETVAQVLAAASGAGFTKIAFVTE